MAALGRTTPACCNTIYAANLIITNKIRYGTACEVYYCSTTAAQQAVPLKNLRRADHGQRKKCWKPRPQLLFRQPLPRQGGDKALRQRTGPEQPERLPAANRRKRKIHFFEKKERKDGTKNTEPKAGTALEAKAGTATTPKTAMGESCSLSRSTYQEQQVFAERHCHRRTDQPATTETRSIWCREPASSWNCRQYKGLGKGSAGQPRAAA